MKSLGIEPTEKVNTAITVTIAMYSYGTIKYLNIVETHLGKLFDLFFRLVEALMILKDTKHENDQVSKVNLIW